MAKKILGLDLGSNSIGWALITENTGIIDAGSRVFPEGVNREKGVEVSKNEDRRLKRQIRRQYYRRKMRKMMVAKLLMEHHMFPHIDNLSTVITDLLLPDPLRSFFTMNPYELRVKAYKGEKLTPLELGRIFYQFAQRRGYKSSLQANNEESVIFDGAPDLGKPGINETRAKAEEFGTLGNYLHSLNPLEERKRNRYVGRDAYLNEFEVIWTKQQKHHPQLLTAELKRALGDEEKGLLFYQRALKSQKSKVGRCTFEKDKPRTPISNPIFEYARIYQFINSVLIDGMPLTHDERETVFEHMLGEARNFDFLKIKKKLKKALLPSNYADDFKAPGSPFLSNSRKAFGKERWDRLTLEEQESIWQIKYFAKDKEWLQTYCKEHWSLDGKATETFCKFNLDKPYAALSRKALVKILAFLENGYKYHEAVWLAGVKNAFGEEKWNSLDDISIDYILTNSLEILNKPGLHSLTAVTKWFTDEFKLTDKELKKLYHHSELELPDGTAELLPAFTKNIRNPLVQQTIFELRKVVNAIITKYGKPDVIRLEMARELKLPAGERAKINKTNSENEQRNTRLKEQLMQLGIPVTGSYLMKLKLFEELKQEQGVVSCPYTGKTIGIKELFDDNQVQVEHIIPYSISLDDSFANKTLCIAKENQLKGDKTPFQYYGNDSAHWAVVKVRAKNALPYRKYLRFISEENPALDDFLSRQLNDNRYASRIALNYLMHICTNVRVSRGELTAKLRRLWGLDGILTPPLAAEHLRDGAYVVCVDKENNITEAVAWAPANYKKETERLAKKGLAASGYVKHGKFFFDKQRDDHRHHALDAVVIACSETRMVQQLSTLHGRIHRQDKLNNAFQVEMPWDTFYRDVKQKIEQVLISYRKRNKTLTPIHKWVDIVVDGQRLKVRSNGYGARGELHKESVYGRYTYQGVTSYHIRKGLESFKKVKQLAKIVDDGIRNLITATAQAHLGVDVLTPDMELPSEIFFKRKEDGTPVPQLYLPNKNGSGIPIKKVRIKESSEKAVNLHEGFNQWVSPQNNHHVVIYENPQGSLEEKTVSFWEAVERKKQGRPVYSVPDADCKLVTTLQINNLFMLQTDNTMGAKGLNIYRIQKISDGDYTFRLAFATGLNNPNEEIRIASIKKWTMLAPVKVKIDVLGHMAPV